MGTDILFKEMACIDTIPIRAFAEKYIVIIVRHKNRRVRQAKIKM